MQCSPRQFPLVGIVRLDGAFILSVVILRAGYWALVVWHIQV